MPPPTAAAVAAPALSSLLVRVTQRHTQVYVAHSTAAEAASAGETLLTPHRPPLRNRGVREAVPGAGVSARHLPEPSLNCLFVRLNAR